MKFYIAIATLLTGASPSLADCIAGDFAVISFKPGADDACRGTPCPSVRLPAEIKNNCPKDAGAMVKITSRDKSGLPIETNEGWPASTRNIPAGGTYAFDLGPLFTYSKKIASFEIEVIDARTWR